MLVLNAGLETIEFGFNQNARNRKEGGFYVITPGAKCDVPETARDSIHNPNCGPALRGLVILDYGISEQDAHRQGLERYTQFLNQRIEWELQRQEEKKQVGITITGDTLELKNFKQLLAKAEEKLNGNALGNGNAGAPESQRPADGKTPVPPGHNKKSA